jgi:hypothetical protein
MLRHVRLSVGTEQPDCHRRNFREISFRFGLQSYTNNKHSKCRSTHTSDNIIAVVFIIETDVRKEAEETVDESTVKTQREFEHDRNLDLSELQTVFDC